MDGREQGGHATRGAWTTLAALLAVALAIRVWAVFNLEGHGGDVRVIAGWAERMAEVGPLRFYEGQLAIYPALLYLYWPLGVLLDGEALNRAIEAQSIPFDLAVGVLLFLIGRRAGSWRGVAASALYLLNPAVVIAGPMWGQVDAAGTVAFIGALLAATGSRWVLAGALAVLAGLVKPQFGLVALPVGWCVIAAWRDGGSLRPVRRALLGALAAYAVVAGPLLLDPLRYADQLYEIGRSKPLFSAGAPNPWGLLVGYEAEDGAFVWVGLALLAGGLGLALVPLRRGRDLGTLLTVGLLVTFAFYFLPTRVHERYLFPALALLAPPAVRSRPLLGAYALLSIAYAGSLLAALSRINPPSIAEPMREVLLSPAAPWVMGIGLMASAVTAMWLLLRRPMSSRG
ncbi:MAG TPA: hypothetical protein VFH63_08605 [candidate division Zixibacteria bacterium]|nr:hypothetical protein [candidate division Zixibacteria bacterium]